MWHKFYLVYQEFKRKEVGILPTYISYYFLLSFIPLIGLILTALSLLGQSDEVFLSFLKDVFPENVFLYIKQFVAYYGQNTRIFTINNLVLLYLTSRIYYAIYHSNTIIIQQKCCRNFIFDKLIAMLNTLIILVTIIVLALVIILGNYFVAYLEHYLQLTRSGATLINACIGITAVIGFNCVVMLSLPQNQFKFRHAITGGIVSAVIMLILSFGFKIYVDYYSNYNPIYYTFSTIIAFILWIYFISQAIVIGLITNYLINKNSNSNGRNKRINERSKP